jgi:hypothetical protein
MDHKIGPVPSQLVPVGFSIRRIVPGNSVIGPYKENKSFDQSRLVKFDQILE